MPTFAEKTGDMNELINSHSNTEVMTFRKQNILATVVTDGLHFATYTPQGTRWHDKLSRAIAHLEKQGFSIVVDGWSYI